MSQKTDPRPAIQDLLDAIRGVFKKYSKPAREKSWQGIQSAEGRDSIQKLIKNPAAPVTGTSRFLKFKEWLVNCPTN